MIRFRLFVVALSSVNVWLASSVIELTPDQDPPVFSVTLGTALPNAWPKYAPVKVLAPVKVAVAEAVGR